MRFYHNIYRNPPRGKHTCACVKRTLRFLRCVKGNCIAAAAVATADAALSALDDNPDIWPTAAALAAAAAPIPVAPPRIKLETTEINKMNCIWMTAHYNHFYIMKDPFSTLYLKLCLLKTRLSHLFISWCDINIVILWTLHYLEK